MSSIRIDSRKPVRALSYVKKSHKDFFSKHNTWTSTTMKTYYAYNSMQIENFKEISVITTASFDIFTEPITNRIETYEKKYIACMNKKSELSNWIKNVQSKGPPSPLNEGYTPPPRSRLPDYFNFPSLSTKRPKRKKLSHHDSTPSSLSTLFKKATETLSNKQLLIKRQQNNKKRSAELNKSMPINQQPRFSFSTSLGRFSLSKNNNNTKRFSVPASTNKSTLSNYQTLSSPSSSAMNKSSNSTILPNSPTSIFIQKLRSSSQLQQDLLETTYDNDSTPPTSPSTTIDSITPPLSPSSHHFKRSQEIVVSSLQDIIEEDSFLQPPLHTMKKKKKHSTTLFITPSISSIRLSFLKSHPTS